MLSELRQTERGRTLEESQSVGKEGPGNFNIRWVVTGSAACALGPLKYVSGQPMFLLRLSQCKAAHTV